MKNYVIDGFVIEKPKFESNAPGGLTMAGVNMPVGAEVIGLVASVTPGGGEDGIAILARIELGATRAWHPLRVIPYGIIFPAPAMPLTLGAAIGIVPGPHGPTTIFPDLPWPTALDTAEPQGEA